LVTFIRDTINKFILARSVKECKEKSTGRFSESEKAVEDYLKK
jgi:hypothetical protein